MKYLLFKNLEVFINGGFSITEGKLYPVELSTEDIQFSIDDANKQIGISIYADPLVVEIVDEDGVVLNQIFIEE